MDPCAVVKSGRKRLTAYSLKIHSLCIRWDMTHSFNVSAPEILLDSLAGFQQQLALWIDSKIPAGDDFPAGLDLQQLVPQGIFFGPRGPEVGGRSALTRGRLQTPDQGLQNGLKFEGLPGLQLERSGGSAQLGGRKIGVGEVDIQSNAQDQAVRPGSEFEQKSGDFAIGYQNVIRPFDPGREVPGRQTLHDTERGNLAEEGGSHGELGGVEKNGKSQTPARRGDPRSIQSPPTRGLVDGPDQITGLKVLQMRESP
jgi:hypothetical protein